MLANFHYWKQNDLIESQRLIKKTRTCNMGSFQNTAFYCIQDMTGDAGESIFLFEYYGLVDVLFKKLRRTPWNNKFNLATANWNMELDIEILM